MSQSAETIWLDRLENLPTRSVVVFTTNYFAKLSRRFRDRCVRLGFESDAAKLQHSVRLLLSAIWKAETQNRPPVAVIDRIIDEAVEDGRLSFRRAVRLLQPCIEGRTK
jgi:hypothetical protein